MRTDRKRFPTLTDTDPMPFGKYKDRQMSDVPCSYLKYLWENGMSEERSPVANYIWNSQDAIAEELGEQFP